MILNSADQSDRARYNPTHVWMAGPYLVPDCRNLLLHSLLLIEKRQAKVDA